LILTLIGSVFLGSAVSIASSNAAPKIGLHSNQALRCADVDPKTAGAKSHTAERVTEVPDQLRTLRNRLREQRRAMAALRAERNTISWLLAERARRGIEHARKVIALTGIDAPGHAPEPRQTLWSAGLALATAEKSVLGDELQTAKLTNLLHHWSRLQRALRRMPLIAPLDHYDKSSAFGQRLHPILKREAPHYGVDFAYYEGAEVLSTAAGTVVFAGRRGGYGNLIEIDHGMGIRTRYAHLQKILVKTGDAVEFRKAIALLGSTGRSTGPHVHYEILVNGRPVDPMKFITAGKYAFNPVPADQAMAANAADGPQPGPSSRNIQGAKQARPPRGRDWYIRRAYARQLRKIQAAARQK
jgi:murein DD-endopeptidase MepM/ murein hydrolase activator NlpD